MKIHTTNYFNSLIEVAEDTKVKSRVIPPNEEGKIAIYGMETKEYMTLLDDKNIKKLKVMKSKK
ncbi:MAG: DUF6157 family protein [Bacteroidaceae bacterium]|nr:DUF6157 family protein [Bacteroidaceae bacterium]MEA5099850.1 DUF6157 family protein [Bacteroidales bacterium]